MTAQALLAAHDDHRRFARSLAWRLRAWLLGPPAAIGMATLRGILRLWLGFSQSRSGVFSAGNGPAMRAPILGVLLGGQPERLRRYIAAATRITHTDPLAEQGAMVVALSARYGLTRGPGGVDAEDVITGALEIVGDRDLAASLRQVRRHLAHGGGPRSSPMRSD